MSTKTYAILKKYLGINDHDLPKTFATITW